MTNSLYFTDPFQYIELVIFANPDVTDFSFFDISVWIDQFCIGRSLITT